MSQKGYAVRIYFEGICAFLPSEEIKAGKPLDWVSVFMVDTDGLKPRRRPHNPLLTFNLADLTGQDPKKVDPAATITWPLDKTDIFIDVGSSGGSKIDVAYGYAKGEKPSEDNDEVSDFMWVPRLDLACPQEEAKGLGLKAHGGQVAEACLREKPRLVISRIHLNKGKLFVETVIKSAGEVSVSQFVPSEVVQPLRQALSEKVALDIEGVKEPVRVKLRNFTTKKWKTISLGAANRTQQLNLYFTNLCYDGGRRQSGGEGEWGRDEDFELFYLLAGVDSKDLAGLPAPVPVRFRTKIDSDEEGGTVFKRCTESQLYPLGAQARKKFENLVREIYDTYSA